MDKLWRYFAVTCLAFGIVGIYVLAAFNLKVFNRRTGIQSYRDYCRYDGTEEAP